jgi:hypothetical protein
MPTVNVCGNCRNICAKCHSSTNSSHPVWVCMNCNHKYNSGPCCSCGKPKKGNVGAGKVCNSCFEQNRCTFCGGKI